MGYRKLHPHKVMTSYFHLGCPVSSQQAPFSSGPLPLLASAGALMTSLPFLQIFPTGFALTPSPLAGTFDFHCTKKMKSSELFQLPSLKIYSVTCIWPRLESKGAGFLLYGASPFTSVGSRSYCPALFPHPAFPLPADSSTTACSTTSSLLSQRTKKKSIPGPSVPSHCCFPRPLQSSVVGYTRCVCFPASYLPFIFHPTNPAHGATLPEYSSDLFVA